MNAALIALAGANPGLIGLAFLGDHNDQPDDQSDFRQRLRVDADARHAEVVSARYRNDIPADIRGLDPEEDGRLIDEIIAGRSLEEQLVIAEADARCARRDRNYDVRGLDPEEDGWLIDKMLAQRRLMLAANRVRVRELKTAIWVRDQAKNAEGRP